MQDLERIKTQILSRVDLATLVGEHVTLRRSGSRLVGLCPFHAEKTPSFSVNPDLGLFKCFGCGQGGDLFTFVQLREHVDFMEALRWLADRAGVEWQTTSRAPGEVGRQDLARVNQWAAEFFRRQLLDERAGASVREYLSQRGIAPEISERFGLGLAVDEWSTLLEAARRAGHSDRALRAADLVREGQGGRLYDTFRHRLMFPIRDATQRVIGFGGRTLGDDRAKYLNTSQNALFDKGRGLYGLDLARAAMAPAGRAIVVEGYTDCLAAHQAGFAETVATLGTALTPAQVDLLRRYTEQVILLFDSDTAGETAAERGIRVALPRHVTVRLARIPEGKDPADFLQSEPPASFAAVLDRARDALEFKWQQTRQRFAGETSSRARHDAVVDFLGVVAEACRSGALDAIERGQIINGVAHLIQMPTDEVRRLVAQLERQGRRLAGEGDAPPRRSSGGHLHPWARVLAVLLNEPGWGPRVAEQLVPDRIDDPADRAIAEAVRACIDLLGGEFHLADVMARLTDPAVTQRAAELAEQGALRANYEATLATALAQLQQQESAEQALDHARRLADAGDDDQAGALSGLHGLMKEHRHFAPRRLIRRPEGSAGSSPAGEGS